MKKEILESCKYWEDLRPMTPFNYKAKQVSQEHKISQEEAEKYLSYYQKNYQIEVISI